MKIIHNLKRLHASTRGNFGILTSLLIIPVMLSAGAALDHMQALNRKADLQEATDSAVLAAASNYGKGMKDGAVKLMTEQWLSAHGTLTEAKITGPTLNVANRELCLEVAENVPTTLMKIVAIDSVAVSVESCAAVTSTGQAEIALVVDVSSSMEENKRFVPMQTALRQFVSRVSQDGNNSNASISIVPFSSRVSIGATRTGWLRAYDGQPAVPARWTDPQSTYDPSKYTFVKWVDGKTVGARNSSNQYWIGCIEPRADVSMKDTGKVSPASLSDDPPQTSRFVPMDTNPRSKKSFCPQPIVPLTNDFKTLQNAVSSLISEGSTRLDAGLIAGWYALSPRWRTSWGGQLPRDYSKETKKILVFMTDGEMNAKYGKDDNDGLDWLCLNQRSDACSDTAVTHFLTICESIKKAGIDIYTISYSKDADIANLRKCASKPSQALVASTDTISVVYDQISQAIVTNKLRLTQ
ncbi:hypothetical protein G6L28_20225 [Agrobacterium larrymoorei]|uniref:pilus assembly protein TadG-related protein n=1 Tax=Agrobacterium larrymoorei TaxID=160699 RepID=UPI001573BCB3|nr:pilus assembly protein TadG-related protein [Agrobacterium larrymoorei]NTJ44923.1 hypothetical protein [Agrobacterium larrymoorei]